MGDMFGGPSAPPPRRLGEELPKIFNVFRREELPAYRQFARQEPLLSGARELALGSVQQEPGLEQLLSSAWGEQTPIGTLRAPVEAAYGQAVPTPGLTNPLYQTYQEQITPILQSGGALTPQMERDVEQQTRAGFAARGNVLGNQALGTELLNRDVYQQQRYNQALQQAQGVTGAISGLDTQALQNALAYSQGLRGLDTGALSSALGYAQGLQGLRQTPLQNLLQTEQVQTGTFGNLLSPTQQYAQDLFNTNYNAQAAANINAANKTGSTIGSAAQLAGTAAMFASDERLKENIRDTGERTKDGIPIKEFNFRHGRVRYRGVIAQDVEKLRPDAVIADRNGYKFVDYDALGVKCQEVKNAS